ncbi:unnamed protein product [Caenorhabditis sp. 36 PRJEB53466]|nr:unnamed protein product [Caenorhabditis sp. 36 PRJEB53466]
MSAFPLLVLLLLLPVASAQLTLNELEISAELRRKMLPLPTVPTHVSRSHRVGAQRYHQFGQRCWHLESCKNCVCCGSCGGHDFLCSSPAGSVDYCLLYEKISMHTNLEKQNETMAYQLPADFPDIK